MSSFIAHSIPAISLYCTPKSSKPVAIYSSNYARWWLLWLIVVAWAPDIDHGIPMLHASAHQGLRITHSLVACLMLPTVTIAVLRSRHIKGRELQFLSIQLVLAALSHLVFDLLTGAMALPLLYPFSLQAFKLPFGLLPSAGKISLNNYYFYRNLGIEMGILLPLFTSLHWQTQPSAIATDAIVLKQRAILTLLLTTSLSFIIWAASLSR